MDQAPAGVAEEVEHLDENQVALIGVRLVIGEEIEVEAVDMQILTPAAQAEIIDDQGRVGFT